MNAILILPAKQLLDTLKVYESPRITEEIPETRIATEGAREPFQIVDDKIEKQNEIFIANVLRQSIIKEDNTMYQELAKRYGYLDNAAQLSLNVNSSYEIWDGGIVDADNKIVRSLAYGPIFLPREGDDMLTELSSLASFINKIVMESILKSHKDVSKTSSLNYRFTFMHYYYNIGLQLQTIKAPVLVFTPSTYNIYRIMKTILSRGFWAESAFNAIQDIINKSTRPFMNVETKFFIMKMLESINTIYHKYKNGELSGAELENLIANYSIYLTSLGDASRDVEPDWHTIYDSDDKGYYNYYIATRYNPEEDAFSYYLYALLYSFADNRKSIDTVHNDAMNEFAEVCKKLASHGGKVDRHLVYYRYALESIYEFIAKGK